MKVIIYGIGSFAEYISYAISNDSNYDVIGFCVDRELINKIDTLNGLPVVPFETVQNFYPPPEYDMFIAVGDNEIREKKFQQAIEKGFDLLSYISSKSTTWENLKYGKNVFISEGSGIQPFVKIGDNSIVIGAKVGHHSEIGKNNLLSCCCLAGNVIISNNSFLGLNSSVKQGTFIGNNNIIGMGCTIVKNTSDNDIYSINKMTKKSNIPSTAMKKKYLM
jgi:sugar O-acyltransferase (sialic acid O-acetyltransferase NeuD family)